MSHRPLRARTASALTVAIIALGLVALASTVVLHAAPVVAEGVVAPHFVDYRVDQVSVAGERFYVDRSGGLSDAVAVGFLLAVSLVLLRTARLLRRAGVDEWRTLATAAFGALYLALDDLLAVHETVGHNLGLLASLPVVDHPDDAIMGVYGLLVLGFLVRHRRMLLGAPVAPWVGAVVLGGLSVVHDMLPLGFGSVEETLEVACAMMLLLGVGLLARARLRSTADRRATDGSAAPPIAG